MHTHGYKHWRTARLACHCMLLCLVRPLLVVPLCVAAEGVFLEDSFKSDITLTPTAKSRKAGPNLTVGPIPTGVAWDGSNIWTATGGATDTINLMTWSSSGSSLKAHAPQLDIRSIWTQGNGEQVQLFADAYSDDHVYAHKAEGTFEATGVSLRGAGKDMDSPVLHRAPSLPEDPHAGVLTALDGSGAMLEFDAVDGKFIRDVPLNGYGAEPGEADWPSYVRFAIAQVDPDRFYYLTYAGGRVFAWDREGERVGSATLTDAEDDEMGCHSFSYANDRAWIFHTASGGWKGFKLAFKPPPPPPVPSNVQAPAAKAAEPVDKPADAGADADADAGAGAGPLNEVNVNMSDEADTGIDLPNEVCPTAT